MRVVTLGALATTPRGRPPFTVSIGGLGEATEAQARNTRAVAWFIGIAGAVGLGSLLLWRAASR